MGMLHAPYDAPCTQMKRTKRIQPDWLSLAYFQAGHRETGKAATESNYRCVQSPSIGFVPLSLAQPFALTVRRVALIPLFPVSSLYTIPIPSLSRPARSSRPLFRSSITDIAWIVKSYRSPFHYHKQRCPDLSAPFPSSPAPRSPCRRRNGPSLPPPAPFHLHLCDY